jgi:Flp pilus assembly protein TadD
MLDVQFFGLNAGRHHLTSLCLHVLNTVLLFLVLWRMTARRWQSAFVAALFALHPLHVQSVAWVAERKDVLSAFFFMATLIAYLRFVARKAERQMAEAGMWFVIALVLFALGLMSKPMLVTLPFILLLLDYWPLRRLYVASLAPQPTTADLPFPLAPQPSSLLHLLLEKLPFLALSAASCAVTLWAQREAGAVLPVAAMTFAQRLANAIVGCAGYLEQVFWPANLAVLYPIEGDVPAETVILSAAGLAAITGWAVWSLRARPHLGVGWFWYLGMLVPVIGLVQVGMQRMADRYTYLPLIGVFVMLAWEIPERLNRWGASRQVLVAAACAALLGCAVTTRAQLRCWRDSEALFRHAIATTPGNYVAHGGLGLHLFNHGKVDEAIREYETALRINPLYDVAHNDLGRALASQKQYDQAAAHFQTALSLRPDDAKALNNYGGVLVLQGRYEEAVRQFEHVVRIEPDHSAARNNLAISFRKLGRIGEAITQYREAIRLQPDSPEALNNLAWLLAACTDARFRNGNEAVGLATRACELTHYQNPVALATLASAYAETGKFSEAVTFAERAQQLALGPQPALPARLFLMLEDFRAGRAYHAD